MWLALGGIVAAIISATLAWQVAKRTTSGAVATSDAQTIFTAAEQIRLELRDDLVAARREVTGLRAENTAMRTEITSLRAENTAMRKELRAVCRKVDLIEKAGRVK